MDYSTLSKPLSGSFLSWLFSDAISRHKIKSRVNLEYLPPFSSEFIIPESHTKPKD
jgi:hypothetical protein